MRKALLFLVLTCGGLLSMVSPSAAASPHACNQGTMHAHHTVPEGNPAHQHIPECG
jgi:hypothetical protein